MEEKETNEVEEIKEEETPTEIVEDLNETINPKPPKKSALKAILITIAVLVGLFVLFFIGLVVKEIISPTEEKEKEQEEVVVEEFAITNILTAYVVDGNEEPLFISTQFATDTPAIFVALEYENVTVEKELTAYWYYQDGTLITDHKLTVPVGSTNAWFNLTKPINNWFLGDYQVIIKAGDDELEQVSFVVMADDQFEEKLFADPSFEVAFYYPNHWIYEILDAASIIFSGPEGSEEYQTTVNLQNLLTTAAGGDYDDIEDLLAIYEAQVLEIDGEIGQIERSSFESFGENYSYIKATLRYEQNEVEFLQWLYLIERDEEVIHQLSYTAPVDLFEEYETNFFTIVNQFKIIK